MFSSLSAHIVAFAGTFFDAGHMLGANPMVLTAMIAYFGSLSGCMTNFSTGKRKDIMIIQMSEHLTRFYLLIKGMSAMYYATGYVSRPKWFMIGFQVAIFYLFVYFTVGVSWWKFLGWI